MMENALSILIVIFSVQLQQTEISERKRFIFHRGHTVTAAADGPFLCANMSKCTFTPKKKNPYWWATYITRAKSVSIQSYWWRHTIYG